MDIECIEEMREILTNSKIRNIKYGYRLYMGDFNFKEIIHLQIFATDY
jgi:hypothetical protein